MHKVYNGEMDIDECLISDEDKVDKDGVDEDDKEGNIQMIDLFAGNSDTLTTYSEMFRKYGEAEKHYFNLIEENYLDLITATWVLNELNLAGMSNCFE